MLKKIFSAPFLFCIFFFVFLPVCVSWQVLDPTLTPRLVFVAAASLLLMLMILWKPVAEEIPWHRTSFLALTVFILLMAAGVSKSLNPGDAWIEWMKTFLGIPVLLLSTALMQKQDNRITLLKFSQVSTLILSAVYAYQWFDFLVHPKYHVVFDLRQHIASTLGNKNFYGEVTCLMIPFSVISFFTFKNRWRMVSIINMSLLFVSLLTTKSLAALASFGISAFAVIAFLYWIRSENKRRTTGIFSALAGIILIAGFAVCRAGMFPGVNQRVEVIFKYISDPELMDTTSAVNSNSAFERMMLWRNSLRLLSVNPVTGCGTANWKLLYPKYGVGGTRYIEAGNVHYEHPHNDYLLIAAESGIPALIGFLVFLLSLIWISARGMKRNSGETWWYAGILFAILCFALTSFLSFPRVRLYGWVLLSIHAGLLFSLQGNTTTKKLSRPVFSAMMIVLSVVCAWAIYAGSVRWNGEIHSKQLQVAKKQRNFARMVREADKASSFYFPLDETATPFSWYEGMAFFYSGNIPLAKKSYEEALQKNPYHIQLINDLATACEQSGERDRAIELYRSALTVTPYFPHSLLNISACFFNTNQFDSAFIYLDKLAGIRLSYQEQKSYDVFLPAILREKMKLLASSLPENCRDQVTAKAGDAKWLTVFYGAARRNNLPFEKMVADSLCQK